SASNLKKNLPILPWSGVKKIGGGFRKGPNPPSNFHLPAESWGCALSLAISKVPDARRQGVTSEA
ncbi:hypothetical protein, partial [Desulfobacula sp.]|uniref:hypothetical protein n=1 Tax=Desulfobacula sp. TaxID=2593537 RepID=UPI0039B8DCD8